MDQEDHTRILQVETQREGWHARGFDDDMLTKDLDGPLDDCKDLTKDQVENLNGWIERFNEKVRNNCEAQSHCEANTVFLLVSDRWPIEGIRPKSNAFLLERRRFSNFRHLRVGDTPSENDYQFRCGCIKQKHAYCEARSLYQYHLVNGLVCYAVFISLPARTINPLLTSVAGSKPHDLSG